MQEPIRILQMVSSLYSGGSQAMIINLYKNIDRTQVQFDFIVEHPEYDFYKKTIEDLGGRIYVLPEFKGTNIIEVKKAWNDFFENHKEYKVLHSHSRSHASIYLPIARKHGVKTIIHSHNTSNGSGVKAIVKDVLQYPLRHQADYYFACSKQSGKWLFGDDIVNKDNFYVLNNAVDTNKYRFNENIRNQYRKEFNVEDKKVYLQVGSLTKQKNHLFIIDVFKQLVKLDNNCILFVVGVGDLKQEIENKINEYGLNKNVVLLGRREDVNNLLQMADCFVMPSIYEGLSVAAVEAQASGIRCILSDRVSKEVDITNRCEFLPLDVNTWVNCLNNEFDRIDTYQNIIDAGYDIKQTSKWLSDFYKDLANE